MGVKNLWEILDSCKKTLPLHHLQNKRVCIDLSCWMVQLHNVSKSHCSIKDKLYLKGLFHRLRALIALNCSLIFVTDGSIPGIKVSTYRRRLHLDNERTRDESSSNKNAPLQRNMGSEFSCMIKEAKILGSALGVPCLDGIEEGEAQCALLDSESLCDGCFSSDSDIFLFGARTVYRDICLGEGGHVVCYEMDDIEKNLGFGRNSLIALAVLLGCDYSPGVRGIGPDIACQIVRSYGESAVLQRLASQELLLKKKAKCSNKQNQVPAFNNKENIPPHESNINVGHNSNLPSSNQFLQVMDAYLKPKCLSADSQMVQRVLGIHSFQRTKLLQTCHRFFEWPPEKTDEYVLPKIAERDLRRFASLRCTSSNLGVQLPLDKVCFSYKEGSYLDLNVDDGNCSYTDWLIENASYYALASQNALMQQMLTMDNEIGSHNKFPKLLKLSDFARWEPRFNAHLGSVHPSSVRFLDEVYAAPLVGSDNLGWTPKEFKHYEAQEIKDFESETKAYSTLTMALPEQIFYQYSTIKTCASLCATLKTRSLGNTLESKKTLIEEREFDLKCHNSLKDNQNQNPSLYGGAMPANNSSSSVPITTFFTQAQEESANVNGSPSICFIETGANSGSNASASNSLPKEILRLRTYISNLENEVLELKNKLGKSRDSSFLLNEIIEVYNSHKINGKAGLGYVEIPPPFKGDYCSIPDVKQCPEMPTVESEKC
ncbi:single-strand DNA endonuclease 1-like [Bidens hawaiensis]|uniref:single-strand DNA endonuclease 1-like n=1 Tax=Bidens hawaiensis TaxID=980011 RepID=UPI00404A02FA